MQQPADADTLSELARRLLIDRYLHPSLRLTDVSAQVRLLPGRVPAELPLDLPLPPNSRLLGSVVIPAARQPSILASGVQIDIVLDAPGDEAAVLGFYEQALTDRGWTPPSPDPMKGTHFGFSSTPAAPPTRVFCHSPRGPWLSVRVFSVPTGPTDVRIHLDTATPGLCMGRPVDSGGPPIDVQRLPALMPPPRVGLDMMGGGGNDIRWSSNAIAETDMPAAELESYFARQLAAAGWMRRDGADAGPLAWSRWMVPGGEWQGMLYVVEEPEPNRRWLHVRAELKGAGRAAGWSGWRGVGG